MFFKKLILILVIFNKVWSKSLNESKVFSTRGQTDPQTAYKTWILIQQNLSIDISLLTSGISSRLDKVLTNVNISKKCQNGLENLFQSAQARQNWALKSKFIRYFFYFNHLNLSIKIFNHFN